MPSDARLRGAGAVCLVCTGEVVEGVALGVAVEMSVLCCTSWLGGLWSGAWCLTSNGLPLGAADRPRRQRQRRSLSASTSTAMSCAVLRSPPRTRTST